MLDKFLELELIRERLCEQLSCSMADPADTLELLDRFLENHNKLVHARQLLIEALERKTQ